jgi:anti-sigma B factor antagonist
VTQVPTAFTLTLTPTTGGPVVVRVSGELDLATAPQLAAALRDAGPRVIVDMSELQFVDVAGVRPLRDATAAGQRIGVRGATRQARFVLEMTGLARVLDDG